MFRATFCPSSGERKTEIYSMWYSVLVLK